MDNSTDLLEQFDIEKINRRQLLPWWIKVFCWLFMLFGAAAIVCLAIGIFGYTIALSFYGFDSNEPLSLLGLLIIGVVLFKAITAFSLWFEKDYAISLAKIDAVIGIVLCTISMIVLPLIAGSHHIIVRLELILLIPYLFKINKIQKSWTGK